MIEEGGRAEKKRADKKCSLVVRRHIRVVARRSPRTSRSPRSTQSSTPTSSNAAAKRAAQPAFRESNHERIEPPSSSMPRACARSSTGCSRTQAGTWLTSAPTPLLRDRRTELWVPVTSARAAVPETASIYTIRSTTFGGPGTRGAEQNWCPVSRRDPTPQPPVASVKERAKISAYLYTWNEHGTPGLPPNHTKIWGEATRATEQQLKKYAKKMLDGMAAKGMPLCAALQTTRTAR